MFHSLLRATLFFFGRTIRKIFVKLTITGWENLPEKGPLIIISNHFSLFEAPIIGMTLPYVPTYMVAKEMQTHWLTRILFGAFDFIPIWRGQVDRAALKQALALLEKGGIMGIMPEGGIVPELLQAIGTGEQIHSLPLEQTARASAQLLPPRPGAAYLATRTSAQILPIAFLGSEKIIGNMKRLRRTKVAMIIGRPFGPLTLDPTLHGPARREQMDELGNVMMRQLAALMPPENRGPYAIDS
jgi:1-acyl-sn-glycerol-3-phosphate acyltransferase